MTSATMDTSLDETGRTEKAMARILITDDSADIRQLLSALMVEEGHKVLVASDGLKAIEAIDTELPDLMILDIMMPNLDGYGVLREMNERNVTKDVKVLILTAKTAEADWVRGYKLGADQYLTKPFGSDELIAAVNGLLAASKDSLQKKTEEELDRAQLLSRLESIFQDF
jgi:two-component system alkaline phosphatase synthesis response regulator PhoP